MNFDSRFSIGERVLIHFQGGENDGLKVGGYIRAVTFTTSKVRYAVTILGFDPPDTKIISEGMGTTLHNLDSALLEEHPEPDLVDFGFDNLS